MRTHILATMTDDLMGVCTVEEADAAAAESHARSAALWEQHRWKVIGIFGLVGAGHFLLTIAGAFGLYMLLAAARPAAGIFLILLVGYLLSDFARAVRVRLLRAMLGV